VIELAVATPSLGPLDEVTRMLAYDFMRNALLAGTSIAMAGGLVGYFAVLRNQVFTSDALGHVAFAGSLGALVAGVQQMLGLFGSTIAVALGIGALGGRARARDVVIGAVFAWVLGLGGLFLSLYTVSGSTSNGAAGVTVLFGSILGIGSENAVLAAGIALATSAALLLVARPLLFLSIDPDVAAARGLPVRALTAAFLVLLALTVAEAVQVVGALLIFAMVVTPAAIAQRLTARPYAGLLISAGLGAGCVWAGLTLAFFTPWPASFWITGVAFAGFVAVHGAGALQRVAGRRRAATRGS
jgi:zinc/manganese transport system permease protein